MKARYIKKTRKLVPFYREMEILEHKETGELVIYLSESFRGQYKGFRLETGTVHQDIPKRPYMRYIGQITLEQ